MCVCGRGYKTLASKTLVTTNGHWEWVEYPIMFYIPLLSNRYDFLVPGNQTGGFVKGREISKGLVFEGTHIT